jgi:tRNA (cmo5U34)-methyltransferase
MAAEHRVAGHLGVAADEYDRTIRTFIPRYELMLGTIVHWLAGRVPAGGLVVDLGAGTGALSAAILDTLPDVRVQLVDVDPNMLEVAAARCAAHDGRFELRHARFEDPLPGCRAVVATLALHHVRTHDAKRGLYRSIHAALEPGGLVAVGDVLTYADGPERRGMQSDWYEHMATHRITAAEADGHFAQWAEEDVYMTLPDELALIGDAGFPRPEIFWREGMLTVYGGFK